MARGDHIYVERLNRVYVHHGIDTGDGSVIHYTSKNWRDPNEVHRTRIEEFAKGGEILIKDYSAFFAALKSPDPYKEKNMHQISRVLNRLKGTDLDKLDPSPDAVIDRAEARIGEKAYNLIFHYCEHFSNWCKTGISNSEQVNAVWKATMSTTEFAHYRAENMLINVFEPKWRGGR